MYGASSIFPVLRGNQQILLENLLSARKGFKSFIFLTHERHRNSCTRRSKGQFNNNYIGHRVTYKYKKLSYRFLHLIQGFVFGVQGFLNIYVNSRLLKRIPKKLKLDQAKLGLFDITRRETNSLTGFYYDLRRRSREDHSKVLAPGLMISRKALKSMKSVGNGQS